MTDEWLASSSAQLSLENGLDSSGEDVQEATPTFLETARNDCSDLQRPLLEIRELLRQTDQVLQTPSGPPSAVSVPGSELTDLRSELASGAHRIRQLLNRVYQAESRSHPTPHRATISTACSGSPSRPTRVPNYEGPDPRALPRARPRPSWSAPLQSAFSSLPDYSAGCCFHAPPADGATVRGIQRQLDHIQCALSGLSVDRPGEEADSAVDGSSVPVFSEHAHFTHGVSMPTEPPLESSARSSYNRRDRSFSCRANIDHNFAESSHSAIPSCQYNVRLQRLEAAVEALTRSRACPGHALPCHQDVCGCDSRCLQVMVSRCLHLLQQQQTELSHLRQLVLHCLAPASQQLAPTQQTGPDTDQADGAHSALNNQVAPSSRANNYWDNFRSHARQNHLSSCSRRSPGGARTYTAGTPGSAIDGSGGDNAPDSGQRARVRKENRNREHQRMRRATDSRNDSQFAEQSVAVGELASQPLQSDSSYAPSPHRSASAAAVVSTADASGQPNSELSADISTMSSTCYRRKQSNNRAAIPPPLMLMEEPREHWRVHGSWPLDSGTRGPSSAPPHELILRNTLTPTGVVCSGGARTFYRWPSQQSGVTATAEIGSLASACSELDVAREPSAVLSDTAVKLGSGVSSEETMVTDQTGNAAASTSAISVHSDSAAHFCTDSLPVRDSGSAPVCAPSEPAPDEAPVGENTRQRSVSTPAYSAAVSSNLSADLCSPEEDNVVVGR